MTRDRLVAVFVAVVTAGGLLSGVAVVVADDAPLVELPAVALFLGAVLAITEAFPLLLLRNEETEGLQLEEAFLVAMALVLPPGTALVAFALGVTCGVVLRRRPVRNTVFNIGQATLAASAALAVMHGIGAPGEPDIRVIAAAAAGAGVYFAVNTLAVALIIAVAEGTPFRRSLFDALPVRAVIWAGSVSLGLLLGLAVNAYPWVLPCLAAPLAVLYWSFGGQLRAWRAQQRVTRLFRTAMDAHAAAEVDAVAEVVAGAAADLLDCNRAEVRATPPAEGELGVIMPTSGPERRWLVVADRRGVEPFGPPDVELLDAVAAVGAAALERARLDEEAERERRRMADLLASASDGIFSVGDDLRVRSWNPAMARLTGYSESDAIGAPCGDVFRTTDVGCADLSAAPQPLLVQLETGHGQERWVTCVCSLLRGGGFMVVARDVTAEREAEELKADFLAMVSHELRTPLTPIKGFLHTLIADDGELSADTRREIHELMLHQSDRLQRLVLDLLDATSLGDPDHRILTDAVDWSTVVSRTVDLFRLHDPERRFDLEIEPGLPRVWADGQRADQVLTNLIDNALRYAPAASPVSVTVVHREGEVATTVADRGPGVAPADREHVFERFRRLGSHLYRPGGGLGLGLYIARLLVERMGGTIEVGDAPGGGAAFTFTLPVTAPAASQEPVEGATA